MVLELNMLSLFTLSYANVTESFEAYILEAAFIGAAFFWQLRFEDIDEFLHPRYFWLVLRKDPSNI